MLVLCQNTMDMLSKRTVTGAKHCTASLNRYSKCIFQRQHRNEADHWCENQEMIVLSDMLTQLSRLQDHNA